MMISVVCFKGKKINIVSAENATEPSKGKFKNRLAYINYTRKLISIKLENLL